jgi:hypothetical protein
VSSEIAHYEMYKMILTHRDKGFSLVSSISMDELLSYPTVDKDGAEYSFYLEGSKERKFIYIDGDLSLNETLDLDQLEKKAEGLLVSGNLIVDGSILNNESDYGGTLIVLGDVIADCIIAGGSVIHLKKECYVHAFVISFYNHGVLDINKTSIPFFVRSDGSFELIYQDKYYDERSLIKETKKKYSFISLCEDEEYYFNEHKFLEILKEIKLMLKLYRSLLTGFSANNPELLRVKEDGLSIKYIENPTVEIQLEAVKENAEALRYIKHPSEFIQEAALKSDIFTAFSYIDNPSDELILFSLKQSGYILSKIKNPSRAMQKVALRSDGYAIKSIINPDDELIKIALKQCGDCLEYIDNPTEEQQIIAVKQSSLVIQHIKNPSEKVQLASVIAAVYSFSDIRNPTKFVILETLERGGYMIEYVTNPTQEMKLLAVKNSDEAIQYIDTPDEEIQLASVKNDVSTIKDIKDPTPIVQEYVMKKNHYYLQYIKRPSEAVKKYVLENAKEEKIEEIKEFWKN